MPVGGEAIAEVTVVTPEGTSSLVALPPRGSLPRGMKVTFEPSSGTGQWRSIMRVSIDPSATDLVGEHQIGVVELPGGRPPAISVYQVTINVAVPPPTPISSPRPERTAEPVPQATATSEVTPVAPAATDTPAPTSLPAPWVIIPIGSILGGLAGLGVLALMLRGPGGFLEAITGFGEGLHLWPTPRACGCDGEWSATDQIDGPKRLEMPLKPSDEYTVPRVRTWCWGGGELTVETYEPYVDGKSAGHLNRGPADARGVSFSLPNSTFQSSDRVTLLVKASVAYLCPDPFQTRRDHKCGELGPVTAYVCSEETLKKERGFCVKVKTWLKELEGARKGG